MSEMIYQSFVLDKKEQRKLDKTKKSIDNRRGQKLITFLKIQYTVILVSNSTYAGVHDIIMVGAELSRAENIKTDLGKISQKLGLFFVSGAFFTEAI